MILDLNRVIEFDRADVHLERKLSYRARHYIRWNNPAAIGPAVRALILVETIRQTGMIMADLDGRPISFQSNAVHRNPKTSQIRQRIAEHFAGNDAARRYGDATCARRNSKRIDPTGH